VIVLVKALLMESSTPVERCAESDKRVKGIEPSCAAWEAAVLPLNYTRVLEEVNGDR
jgi:hypothetical protein